jgi:hypothetical protein
VRLLAQQVLDAQHVRERQVAVVALELLGQRLPADERPPVDLGDLAQLVRASRRPELARQLGADEDQPEIGTRSAPSAQQPAHPVADAHVSAEPLHGRDDVLGVRLERQRRPGPRSRPVVVAQVERVALPAAAAK